MAVPFEPPVPALQHLARFEVEVGDPLELGETPAGRRRIIPIQGGRFQGPAFQGTILPGGADWQLVLADGTAVIDTRYTLRTADDALIYITTRGYRSGSPEVLARIAAGEPVDPRRYYFRVLVGFETGHPAYRWLTTRVCVGAALRLKNLVVYDAYQLT
ncbi:MAG TPA: DUF3237 domain-containing protein [Chloroflexota bacterium]|jgi:hypothetical protein|nr:DUF3237 domain-containing protein [Chloroflexota bacterium]